MNIRTIELSSAQEKQFKDRLVAQIRSLDYTLKAVIIDGDGYEILILSCIS